VKAADDEPHAVPEADKRIERIVDGPHLLATTNSNIVNRFALAFLKRCASLASLACQQTRN
jgi:hypothetical protein